MRFLKAPGTASVSVVCGTWEKAFEGISMHCWKEPIFDDCDLYPELWNHSIPLPTSMTKYRESSPADAGALRCCSHHSPLENPLGGCTAWHLAVR